MEDILKELNIIAFELANQRENSKMSGRVNVTRKDASRSDSMGMGTLDGLVSMDAEALGLPNWKDAKATDTVKRINEKWTLAVTKILKEWVDAKNAQQSVPGEVPVGYLDEGLVANLLDEDGAYLVFMTVAGHGVGIWDGSWDHLLDRGLIEDLKDYIKRSGYLSHVYQEFEAAILEAAYDTASAE